MQAFTFALYTYWLSKSCTGNHAVFSRCISVRSTFSLSGKKSIVKEQGWTKAAMFKMRKLDSFLREVQRVDNSFPGEDS